MNTHVAINDNPQTIETRLEILTNEFEEALKTFRRKKYTDSLGIVQKLVDKIINLIHQMNIEYSQNLYNHKLPHFFELKSSIQTCLQGGEVDQTKAHDILFQMSLVMKSIRREINNSYASPPRINKFGWPVFSITLIFVLSYVWIVKVPSRSGLIGQYFRSHDFKGSSKKKTDKAINFNWKNRPPLRSFAKEGYAVRWTGFLRIPSDGKYEIKIHADDVMRVWLGQTRILSVNHKTNKGKGSVHLSLTKGYYPIRIEYFQNGGRAFARLYWKWSRWTKEKIISRDYLVPTISDVKNGAVIHNQKIRKNKSVDVRF